MKVGVTITQDTDLVPWISEILNEAEAVGSPWRIALALCISFAMRFECKGLKIGESVKN